VFHQTNSAGFRDRERTIARSPDTLRVAILSDSYGFGWGVKDSDHVSARLEAILRSRRPASAPVEVLNFAVPGYRTKEERLLYEKVVEKYDPQVVLVLTVFNDNPVYDGLGIEDLAAPSLWRFFVPNQESRRQELDYSVCLNEMRQLAERCRGGHRKLMVATFRNNAFDEARWLALHRTMADGLRNEEVPVLDLGQAIGPYLREDWERGFVSRTEDSHPNEEVHRVAAEALAPWLIEHLPSGTSPIPSR
jgi:lysophospholipase L1-like esterase